ncbi:MAG TPA: nuclear transport factor 2 family protein [Pyrinomonadaceae bacterium]|jgi:hypothetical protein|nr:nuclear transport factor 2 family protein [Pyrinomonadaceae bacterium]
MKYCPRCYAAYEDDSQTYCTNEGIRLLVGSPPVSQPTLIAPSQGSGDLTQPELFHSAGSPSAWSGSSPSLDGQKPWSILSADAAPPPSRRRPNLLLMIVGSAALLAVGLIVGLMLANRGAAAVGETGARGSGAELPKPEVMLAELKNAESDITEANIKGDKRTLERMLAEDYIAIAADGKSYNKAQTLASTEPAYAVTSWSIDGAKLLSYGKDTATLTGIITFKTSDMVERQQFTDSFVKRDGRWQAFASQSTVLKN